MNPTDFEKIIYTVNDGVALVTLDNSERRNAWGGRMSVEYRWALHHAHIDTDVRVVVVTGGGEDFCVGADSQDLKTIEQSGGNYQKTKLGFLIIPSRLFNSLQVLGVGTNTKVLPSPCHHHHANIRIDVCMVQRPTIFHRHPSTPGIPSLRVIQCHQCNTVVNRINYFFEICRIHHFTLSTMSIGCFCLASPLVL